MTEKELAAELVTQLLKHGSEPELPFSPIVSGGPNSANPHASPTGRKLQAGDLLVIDYGAMVDGYISDLTRTFAVGQVEAEYEKIHKIVQEANAAGRAAGKPGVPCAEVDKAARTVIESGWLWGIFYAPHRSRHWHGASRGALYTRRQHANPGAGHGLHSRAGDLSARPQRRTCRR